MNRQLNEFVGKLESSGESAAGAVAEHLRMVASNGSEYATADALRDEAENLIVWALDFLDNTGGVPPRLLAQMRRSRRSALLKPEALTEISPG